jgi:hypothetical protein
MIDPLYEHSDDNNNNTSISSKKQVAKRTSVVEALFFGLLLYPFLQGALQGVATYAWHRYFK